MDLRSDPSSPSSPAAAASPRPLPSGISALNSPDDRISSKVERMAAMVDDKTLISSLIRENSNRIGLIEFKDARADIWQHFRLVQLDGQTLAYAVCVRCLKPVSYKAREGTGGLHRHPCSKAAAASSFLPGGAGQQALAHHPLLASVSCSTLPSPATTSSGGSSHKRKDLNRSGISSKGSSISSPSSCSPSSSPPAAEPISSSSSGHPPVRQSSMQSSPSSSATKIAFTPSSASSSTSSSSGSFKSSSNNNIRKQSIPVHHPQQHHKQQKGSASNGIISGSFHAAAPSASVPDSHQAAVAVAAALSNGNSSLSSLSSIMNPFLMNSLQNQQQQQQQLHQMQFNFMYSNGSIKTDCHAMILLNDSQSPAFNPVTEQMTDLFERKVLLDLTLVARNGSIRAHKLAIAAASIVFEEALTADSNDASASPCSNNSPCATSTVEELDLKEYDVSSVRAMIEFIYYGELNDTDIRIPEVMRLAEYYEIKALKFASAQRMYRNLSPDNCIEFLAVAEKCNCEELKQLIPSFIAENASRVTCTNAWKETFKDRSDLVANLLGVTATDLSMSKKRKNF